MDIAQIMLFWILTLHSLGVFLSFRGTCCHDRQNDRICIPIGLQQKFEQHTLDGANISK